MPEFVLKKSLPFVSAMDAWNDAPEEKGRLDGTVMGIVSGSISPLFDKVQPLVMRPPGTNEYPDPFNYIRYNGDAKPLIKPLKKMKSLHAGYPLNWFYGNELYNRSHRERSKVFACFSSVRLSFVLVWYRESFRWPCICP